MLINCWRTCPELLEAHLQPAAQLTPCPFVHPPADKPLTKEQLLPEIGAFILAGFDTSSHTIAWCLFNIAAHPDVQMKIKNELSATGLLHQGQANCVTPRQLAHEDLPRLPYLNAVIDETMQMYPVAATGSVRWDMQRGVRYDWTAVLAVCQEPCPAAVNSSCFGSCVAAMAV
eukprot:GHUV01022361.1.p2 GENE.GHUV01022361.1~~GHUV01022361.1.p2  ORF type:complete len:173 (-),score=44.20 GHUV01022361.1:563-1081(-)